MQTQSNPRAVIVGVQLPSVSDEEFASSLVEIARLARTLGLDVIATLTQKRAQLRVLIKREPGAISRLTQNGYLMVATLLLRR